MAKLKKIEKQEDALPVKSEQTDKLQSIFERELNRLDEESKQQPLDMEQLKRLEILTRSLKQHQKQDVPEPNPFENLSTEQIIELMKS
jgi:hypothetical protein